MPDPIPTNRNARPGPGRPPGNNNDANAGAIAVSVIVAVVIVIALAVHAHHSDHRSSASADTAASTTRWTPDGPDPDPVTTDPDPFTPDPEPTPPPMHYGALAVASDGSYGRAWDYSSASAADRAALDGCPRSDCKAVVDFANACGAIAYNPGTGVYWGGRGDTATEAENSAISNAGGGRWIVYQCSGAG